MLKKPRHIDIFCLTNRKELIEPNNKLVCQKNTGILNLPLAKTAIFYCDSQMKLCLIYQPYSDMNEILCYLQSLTSCIEMEERSRRLKEKVVWNWCITWRSSYSVQIIYKAITNEIAVNLYLSFVQV